MILSHKFLEQLHKLNRTDKLRVIQLLANDLVAEEAVSPEKAELLNDLRESIGEAMTGQTVPVSELWTMLKDDH